MVQRIEIKNRWTGDVIFSHECEDNTVCKTVKKAIECFTDLSSADLRSADLSSANLRSANLRSADLSSANLRSANLRYADLSSADLSSANLRSADLRSADLSSADLRSANLRSADLRYANLRYADLSSAEYNEVTAFLALQCPEEGDFIAWKKVKNTIVELLIPADAQRSSATSRKCRASKAQVLAIFDKDGNEQESVVSDKYVTTTYKVGEDVIPDSWDENRWNECSHGIHFFITRREAELYN